MTASPPDVIFPNLHTQTAAPAGDGRDGCDCPPWIAKCVHYDGRVLVLSSAVGVPERITEVHGRVRGFRVVLSEAPVAAIACAACGFPHRRRGPGFSHRFDDYDEALAAFYAEEEALIRGDA